MDTAILEGEDKGVGPKSLLLASLSGCTGMDVMALLMRRFKVPVETFYIDIEAELTETHPKYYHKIHMVLHIKVAEEHHDKVRDAIQLSADKYCGVHYMLRQTAEISYLIDFL